MAAPATIAIVEEEADVSLISWGAVIAGGMAAAAVTLLLLAFGVRHRPVGGFAVGQ